MPKRIAILAVYFLTFAHVIAQETENKLPKLGVETATFLSYSGINWSAQLNTNYKKHSLGIGFKVAFQTSYFPYKTSVGLVANYKYFLVEKEKIKSFVSVDYHMVKYNVKNRIYSSTNTIHEYTVSNGFLVKLYKKLWFGNSIGVGGYTERYFNFSELEKENKVGYNILLKGFLSYEF